MELFLLGNIEIMPEAFFLRDGMNDPLCLEDSFGNLIRVLPVFNEEKTQEPIGGHAVCKCEEDGSEGICVTNFRFMEQISDVSWP